MDVRTECLGAGYLVGDAEDPLITLSLRVGGPLASLRAEAASLLQLLLDVAGQYGRNIVRNIQLPPTSTGSCPF